ncbi:hypothetical protein F4805DRAFT_445932 [Annulohypoxylon moriforme]|nr:hypothetical protein F4805DRAFT_445932 [Annulohypoxylon moriforme]
MASDEEQAAYIEALLDGPSMEPPTGVIPNFDDTGNHATGYGIIILGSILATIAIVLRMSSRAILRRFRIEDALFISALGLYAGHQYVFYEMSIFPGLWVHQWNFQLKNISHISYNIHIGSVFYGLIIMCLKVGILLDWVRIFCPVGTRNFMFWLSHFLIWANIAFYGIGTLVELFQCTPREKIWNPLYEGGSCPINMHAHNFASGMFNIISDLVILAVPQSVIWKIQMTPSKRIGVSLLFTIGIFACACAIARQILINTLIHSDDIIYNISSLGLWDVGEITAGFMIVGIPSLPHVIRKIPLAESVVSLVRVITGSSRSATHSTPKRELPLWMKPQEHKSPRRWDSVITDEYNPSSVSGTDSTTGLPRNVAEIPQ